MTPPSRCAPTPTCRPCWCGADATISTEHPEYLACSSCSTACYAGASPKLTASSEDPEGFLYGESYWREHMSDLGYPDIHARARTDLTERCQYWLSVLLKHRLPPGGIMELGCAHGGFLKLASAAGFDVLGIEMSPQIAQIGPRVFGVDVLQGPLETIPLGHRVFEAICLFDVLEHLPDPIQTMSLAVQALRDGGLLVIQTPEYEPGRGAAWTHFKAPEHLFLFSRASLDTFLKRLGLVHIDRIPSVFQGDQMVVASASPLATHAAETVAATLMASPEGRMVLAQQDIYRELSHCMATRVAEPNLSAVPLRLLLRAFLSRSLSRLCHRGFSEPARAFLRRLRSTPSGNGTRS